MIGLALMRSGCGFALAGALLLAESLLGDRHFAKGACVIILQPSFNALIVEVVAFVARQGNDCILFGVFDHANYA